MDPIEATHLGKKSEYPPHYDKSVLVAVPRSLNREQYGLSPDALPFNGVDVWHAYEFGFLTQTGMPVTGILKIVYPANNEFLVESKSLKLYLNSFNMDRFGATRRESIAKVVAIIENDLGELLGCPIAVTCFEHPVAYAPHDFSGFLIVETIDGFDRLSCQSYTETPGLLGEDNGPGEVKWGTHLLRSNCKITHQPDWGSLFVHCKSRQLPSPENFLRFVVSLRNENHFHEEICELVFKRIFDCFQPDLLTVACLYTRRGGIDICPVRTTDHNFLPQGLTNPSILTQTIFRQ